MAITVLPDVNLPYAQMKQQSILDAVKMFMGMSQMKHGKEMDKLKLALEKDEAAARIAGDTARADEARARIRQLEQQMEQGKTEFGWRQGAVGRLTGGGDWQDAVFGSGGKTEPVPSASASPSETAGSNTGGGYEYGPHGEAHASMDWALAGLPGQAPTGLAPSGADYVTADRTREANESASQIGLRTAQTGYYNRMPAPDTGGITPEDRITINIERRLAGLERSKTALLNARNKEIADRIRPMAPGLDQIGDPYQALLAWRQGALPKNMRQYEAAFAQLDSEVKAIEKIRDSELSNIDQQSKALNDEYNRRLGVQIPSGAPVDTPKAKLADPNAVPADHSMAKEVIVQRLLTQAGVDFTRQPGGVYNIMTPDGQKITLTEDEVIERYSRNRGGG